jgi:site-specific recombinase XerD
MANDPNQIVLPEFQKYLLERKLAPESHVPFHAHWVNRFLRFASRKSHDPAQYSDSAVTEYLEELHADARITDWQHRQAADALRLYYSHYLGLTTAAAVQGGPQADVSGTLGVLVRLMRLKHYSYSTERTYRQWTERFLAYVCASTNRSVADVTSEDFKNFLAHLALKQRVASSTQNQALL